MRLFIDENDQIVVNLVGATSEQEEELRQMAKDRTLV